MSKYAEDKEGLQIGAKCWVENLTRRQVKTNNLSYKTKFFK